MKATDLIAALTADGWEFQRQSGSHRVYAKPGTPEIITVPVHGARDLSPGIVASARRISGLPLR